MNSKITLINPDSPFLHKPRTMPPLGLLYISSFLKDKGVEVNFVDLAGVGVKPIPYTEFYGITATTPQFPDAVKILRLIKEVNSDSQVCLGGPHSTLTPWESLKQGFDAVIEGEGELAVFDFLEGSRRVIKHEFYDIDSIPFPDRGLVKDYEYKIDGERATTIMTTRGNCPHHCAFCCKSWIHPIKFRSLENVREELREIRDVYGYKAVMIYDDEFFLKSDRDYKICTYFQKLGFIWRCFTRANLVNKNIALMASVRGCKEILMGIESGSDTILKNINKGVTVKQNVKAIKILHDVGIRVKAAIIIGLPGESEKTLKETWEFCEEMDPFVSDWDFTILIPYPGSPIYEGSEGFDITFDKNDVYAPYKGGVWRSIVSTSHLSKDEITKWREKFHRRFKGEVY